MGAHTSILTLFVTTWQLYMILIYIRMNDAKTNIYSDLSFNVFLVGLCKLKGAFKY
jgi:hypothetical protein